VGLCSSCNHAIQSSDTYILVLFVSLFLFLIFYIIAAVCLRTACRFDVLHSSVCLFLCSVNQIKSYIRVGPLKQSLSEAPSMYSWLISRCLWDDAFLAFSYSWLQNCSILRYNLMKGQLHNYSHFSANVRVTSVRLWQREFDLACPKPSNQSLNLILLSKETTNKFV